jgi:hypothetical protein
MSEKSTVTSTEGAKPSPALTGQRLFYWVKRIGYRSWRLFAEFATVIMGLAVIWLYALTYLLTQQSVDISQANNNVGLFFSEVVTGAGVDIPKMRLDWYPATDDIVFSGQDITVKDKDGNPVQTLAELQSYFPLKEVRQGKMIPRRVILNGGVVSWTEDEEGRIKAGLGTPETLGRLGPLWEGRRATPTRDARFDFDGVEYVEVTNAKAYYINKTNGIDVELNNASLRFEHVGDVLSFEVNANLDNQRIEAEIPVFLSVKTDNQFDQFDVDYSAQGLNPNIFGPRKGRYTDLTRLDAPVSLSGRFLFSRSSGLKEADVNVSIGSGDFSLLDGQDPFKLSAFKTRAKLDAGDAIMQIEQFDLRSDRVSFTAKGTLSELDAINDGDVNSSPLFDLNFNNIGWDATPVFADAVKFDALDLRGTLDVDSRELSVERYRLDRGTHRFEGTLFFKGAVGADAVNTDVEAIRADGVMSGLLTPEELLQIWPVKFADGARRWLKRSVLSGDVDSLSFSTEYGLNEEGAFTEEKMDMDYTVRNSTVQYISTMTPMTEAWGTAKISDNALSFTLDRGVIGPVQLLPSRVDIPRLRPKGGDLTVTANAMGQASDLLALINQEPFRYADRYGVDPTTVEGKGQVQLTITRPLLEFFDQSRIRYSAKGEFQNVSAPFSIGPHQLNKGDVKMIADSKSLSVNGPVNIGPWRANLEWKETFDNGATPTEYYVHGRMNSEIYDQMGLGFRQYFDGDIGVDIRALGSGINVNSATLRADLTQAEMTFGEYWNKPVGESGQLVASLTRGDSGTTIQNFQLVAPNLNLAGGLSLNSDFALNSLDLETVKVGDVLDATLNLKPNETRDAFVANLVGQKLDISSLIDRSLNTQTSAFEVPIALNASVDTLVLDPQFAVNEAEMRFAHNGIAVTEFDLNAISPDGPVRIAMTTDEGASQRQVNVKLPNAAKAAQAFLGLESLQGGEFSLTGTLPLAGEEGPYVGNAVIDNFTMTEAPIMAQLLSLGSLTGLFNALSGEGLAFEKFDAPFQILGGNISLRKARVYGPALGMTGEGNINLQDKTVDIDGVLVPAYTANSLLGDVPLLGDIVVGKEGEGIFALNYTVEGPFSETQIAVNPLSALTPGFLRGIFRKKREDIPSMENIKQDPEKNPESETEE